MNLDNAIKSRKSVKKFANKDVNWRDIIECIDVVRYAPTAGGNFILKFIVVNNKENIQKIAEAAQQDFITKARYIIVVCSDNFRIVNAYGKRGEIYSKQQSGAAIQNLLLKIQEKGLATTWVGHFVDEQIKNVLKIPKNVDIEAIFPIGYELGNQKLSPKIDFDRILFFERYGNKKMNAPRKIDV